MKKCVTCLQDKPEQEFNYRYKSLGIRAKICKDCQHSHQRTWYLDHQDQEKEGVRRRRVKAREENREFIYQYLLTHPCVDCSETDPVVLEFDHIKGKGGNISKMVTEGVSLERLKIELSLCVVRCSNCHRRKTSQEGQWYRGRK